MNKYHEAVKKGGDYWANHMTEKMCMAHATNRLTHALSDAYRMEICERYSNTRRAFQNYTPGCI